MQIPTRRAYLRSVGTLGGAVATASAWTSKARPFARRFADRDQEERDHGSPTASELAIDRSPRPLEVVHRWGADSERAAIEAVLDGFHDHRPEIEGRATPAIDAGLIDAGTVDDGTVDIGTVGDGTVDVVTVDVGAALRHRIVTGTPPSTFQHRGGRALDPVVETAALHPIDDLWTAELRAAIRPDARQATSRRDAQYAVPICIRRVNTLFYNVDILERAGVDPNAIDAPDGLLDAIDAVESATDDPAIVHGGSDWPTVQLFSQLLLGTGGLEAYGAVVNGDVAAVREELEETVVLLEAILDRSPNLDEPWDVVSRRLPSGAAAFLPQGDWAVGAFRHAGFDDGEAWDAIAFPGTGRWFVLAVDCFGFPANNPSPDETAAFLSYLGTPDAQRRFARHTGSLPARTDVAVEEFGLFQRWSHREFADAVARIPSIAHGMAVGPDRRRRLEAALESIGSGTERSNTLRAVRRAIES